MQAKLMKVAIPVVLVVLVAFGWLSTIASAASGVLARTSTLDAAAKSYEDGLYQQSILQYKDAMTMGVGVEAYERIHEVYKAYYEEEHTDGVYTNYLNDMTAAYEAYPTYSEFWEQAYDLYKEREDYKGIYLLAEAAIKAKAQCEPLMATYVELSHQTEVVSDAFAEVLLASNGLARANTGEGWVVITGTGDTYLSGYEVMGIPNNAGNYVYVGNYGARLRDAGGVDRARYDDLAIVGAGMLDDATDLVPVQVKGGGWHYLRAHAGTLLEASYDEAGVYVGGRAAVREGDDWFIVDVDGNHLAGPYDDVKTFPGDGCYLMGGAVYFARTDGSYGIYDANFARVGNFSADDVDLYYDGPVAFARDGSWGYVNLDGTIVAEPAYKGARSFSRGRAAVCDKGSYWWGFVDSNFSTVVNADYQEGVLFTTDANALVKTSSSSYAFIGFKYGADE